MATVNGAARIVMKRFLRTSKSAGTAATVEKLARKRKRGDRETFRFKNQKAVLAGKRREGR